MKKLLAITVTALLAALPFAEVQAQHTDAFKDRLATPETGANGHRASVHVTESGGAAAAVRRGDAATAAKANGFRIVIFFDNGSTARSEAERIMEEFSKGYPDVSCDIRYENPYFKVLAGNCVTSEEAVVLLGRVKLSFPEAYIMREEIPIQNFVTPKPRENSDLEGDDADAADAAATV